MSRSLVSVLIIMLLLGPQAVFAATGDSDVPGSIRNNRYFLESVRLTNLAQQSYEEGDYDASTKYSEEAVRYAHLSDDYVTLQLKIKSTDDAIAAARTRLDFATSVNAATRYPDEYGQAQSHFADARSYRSAEQWDNATDSANQVLAALSVVEGDPAGSRPAVAGGALPLPAQYTVRPWSEASDCLWNIAGRAYVYNDPRKWRLLYDANKANMPEPNNPDLIHPGMVLDIPSAQGETRQGMWAANRTYAPLP